MRSHLAIVESRADQWEHVWCAAQLAANTSMRAVEVKHVRRKDFDADKRSSSHTRKQNETSKRVIPLNDSAFDAVQRMVTRADKLGHTEPQHYLWCASQHHKLDPTTPASKWDTAWRALREAAGLPGLRFHDLRHTVVTRLLEAGEPDHVVESITGHLSRRMLEHYSHIRLKAKKAAPQSSYFALLSEVPFVDSSSRSGVQHLETGVAGRTGRYPQVAHP